MIYSITSNGLRPARSADIRPGHVHKMGASSSPKKVFVVNMSDESVTYVPLTGTTDPSKIRFYTERRAIFEDLVADANDTLRKNAEWLTEEYGAQVAKQNCLDYIEGRLPTEKEESRIEIALS